MHLKTLILHFQHQSMPNPLSFGGAQSVWGEFSSLVDARPRHPLQPELSCSPSTLGIRQPIEQRILAASPLLQRKFARLAELSYVMASIPGISGEESSQASRRRSLTRFPKEYAEMLEQQTKALEGEFRQLQEKSSEITNGLRSCDCVSQIFPEADVYRIEPE